MTDRVAVIIGSRDGVLPASDRAAVALAVTRFAGGVRAYTAGSYDAPLEYALAAGAAEARRLADPAALDADYVLLGSAGCEPWGDLLPAAIAEARGAAVIFDVLDVQLEDGVCRVTRDLGRGVREVLAVTGPAVLLVGDAATPGPYVSHHRRQQACRRLALNPSDTPPDPLEPQSSPWEAARPRARSSASSTAGTATDRLNALIGADVSDSADAGELIRGDAVTCARHLVRYLAHHGFVEKTVTLDEPSTIPMPQRQRTGRSCSEMDATGIAISRRVARGPRPLSGPGRGVSRRPVSVRHGRTVPGLRSSKLARAPRPVGQRISSHLRGPYPLTAPTPRSDPINHGNAHA